MIGIVGGVGPYAGIDLVKKVADNTEAGKDQDHVRLMMISFPNIPDRTEFLEGKVKGNPGFDIAKQILKLEKSGATTVGVCCNTAHAAPIWKIIRLILKKKESQVKLVNIVAEVGRAMRKKSGKITKVGVLCTSGSYRYKVYSTPLIKSGFKVLLPGAKYNYKNVHKAIFHPEYGIKTIGIATKKSVKRLNKAIKWYKKAGAEAIVLACTELPIVADQLNFRGMKVIDSNDALARGLIRTTFPEKLRPRT